MSRHLRLNVSRMFTEISPRRSTSWITTFILYILCLGSIQGNDKDGIECYDCLYSPVSGSFCPISNGCDFCVVDYSSGYTFLMCAEGPYTIYTCEKSLYGNEQCCYEDLCNGNIVKNGTTRAPGATVPAGNKSSPNTATDSPYTATDSPNTATDSPNTATDSPNTATDSLSTAGDSLDPTTITAICVVIGVVVVVVSITAAVIFWRRSLQARTAGSEPEIHFRNSSQAGNDSGNGAVMPTVHRVSPLPQTGVVSNIADQYCDINELCDRSTDQHPSPPAQQTVHDAISVQDMSDDLIYNNKTNINKGSITVNNVVMSTANNEQHPRVETTSQANTNHITHSQNDDDFPYRNKTDLRRKP